MPFFTLIVFYAFSALLLGAALGVVLARNTVHSALLLVLAFVASAGLWMLLYAEFLAIVLVLEQTLVMVLFLFVLMMLDCEGGLRRWRLLPVGVAQWRRKLPFILTVILRVFCRRRKLSAIHTRMLGSVIYTDFVYPS